MIQEIEVKSALHYHKNAIPCNRDLNIFRGCSHACQYCFAQYSHSYIESEDFFKEVFVKTNIAEKLEEKIRSKRWKKQGINICGVTDCYQAAEKKFRIMPQVLEVINKYPTPIIITTKSDLILRDKELIEEISKKTEVRIATSITTMDEDLRKILEPGAAPAKNRFVIIETFKKLGCDTTILLMPIIPKLTDNKENLEMIFSEAKNVKVDNIIAGFLNLRGITKKKFFAFLGEHKKELLPIYKKLYPGSTLTKEYKKDISEILFSLRKKYDLFNKYQEKEEKGKQMQLF